MQELQQHWISYLDKYKVKLLYLAKFKQLDYLEAQLIAECIMKLNPEYGHEVYALVEALQYVSIGGLNSVIAQGGNLAIRAKAIKNVYEKNFFIN